MISAPSVMRCRSSDIAFMTMKTMPSTSGTDSATTIPVRQPSARKETNSTIASASTKECTNSPTACSTTLGWSAIRDTSMPCGTAFMNSLVAFSTSLPSSRILAPLAVTTPIPIAGLPS